MPWAYCRDISRVF